MTPRDMNTVRCSAFVFTFIYKAKILGRFMDVTSIIHNAQFSFSVSSAVMSAWNSNNNLDTNLK